MNEDLERERFEAWAILPPFEYDLTRFALDGNVAWPGNYVDLHVDAAWCAWHDRALLAAHPPAVESNWYNENPQPDDCGDDIRPVAHLPAAPADAMDSMQHAFEDWYQFKVSDDAKDAG